MAELVASYLFEKAKLNFCPAIYHGIYRDDSLLVFKGKKKASENKRLARRVSANGEHGVRKPTPSIHHINMDKRNEFHDP